MFRFFIHRVLVMVPTLLVISALVFVIIQLPEGDYLTTYITELESQGESVSKENSVSARAIRTRPADVAAVLHMVVRAAPR